MTNMLLVIVRYGDLIDIATGDVIGVYGADFSLRTTRGLYHDTMTDEIYALFELEYKR